MAQLKALFIVKLHSKPWVEQGTLTDWIGPTVVQQWNYIKVVMPYEKFTPVIVSTIGGAYSSQQEANCVIQNSTNTYMQRISGCYNNVHYHTQVSGYGTY